MTTRSCVQASPHRFELVGYRIPDAADSGTPCQAVLVCLGCGDELRVAVDSSREAQSVRSAAPEVGIT